MRTRKMHLCGILVSVAFLIAGVQVSAQDEVVDWTGWYAGAFGGYVSGELTSDDAAHFESTGDFDDDSPTFGIFGAYNRQFDNNWVAGFELILPLYMQKGTATDKQFHPDSVFYEATYRYGVMVAAKGGKAFNKVLPYGYAAVGVTNVNGKTLNIDKDNMYSEGAEQSAAATHIIWQLGAGADYLVKENLYAGARIAVFTGAKADHTMPWNEPGPNEFGYDAVLFQVNFGYKF
ncbi:MAG: porin family protein [bacterium]|nr:porin family protein [bacterium]